MKLYFVADAHCDTLYELWKNGGSFYQNNLHVSLKKLKAFYGYMQFFAIWVDDQSKTPYEDAMAMLTVYEKELLSCPEIRSVTSRKDMKKVFMKANISALLTLENGKCLEGKIENLFQFYRCGVRGMTLTWNGENELGGGTESEKGLTAFGREVIKQMNALGMMVDVSHASEKTFWDCLEVSQMPVMASHSNAKSICSHKRNLSDAQIRAIITSKGMIGLNLYPPFLTDKKEAGVEDCLRHVEHILSLGGEDALGLGSDFDGFSGAGVKKLENPDEFDVLFLALLKRGYKKELIEKISHKNWLSYLEKILQ